MYRLFFADLIRELGRREAQNGVVPNPDIDGFMKAISLGNQKENLVTDYVMKILGLDICADTLVGNQLIRGVSGGQRKRVTTGEQSLPYRGKGVGPDPFRKSCLIVVYLAVMRLEIVS